MTFADETTSGRGRESGGLEIAEAALGELARLAARVTFKGTLKQIDAALEARAAALGIGRAEVEELAVPAYGRTEVGRLAHDHGELLVRAGKAVPTWRNEAGKEVRSAPTGSRTASATSPRPPAPAATCSPGWSPGSRSPTAAPSPTASCTSAATSTRTRSTSARPTS